MLGKMFSVLHTCHCLDIFCALHEMARTMLTFLHSASKPWSAFRLSIPTCLHASIAQAHTHPHPMLLAVLLCALYTCLHKNRGTQRHLATGAHREKERERERHRERDRERERERQRVGVHIGHACRTHGSHLIDVSHRIS